MRALGWKHQQRRFGKPNPQWCYVKGDGNSTLVAEQDLNEYSSPTGTYRITSDE